MTRDHVGRVLRSLGACYDARAWAASLAEAGKTWREMVAALCAPECFLTASRDDDEVRTDTGEAWLGWTLPALASRGFLNPAEVLRAELAVWEELPELHPFFPEGELDALRAWAHRERGAETLPKAEVERVDISALLAEGEDSARTYVRVNSHDIQLMAHGHHLEWLPGTWRFMGEALRHAGLAPALELVALGRLGTLVDRHHGDRIAAALEEFAASLETPDGEIDE